MNRDLKWCSWCEAGHKTIHSRQTRNAVDVCELWKDEFRCDKPGIREHLLTCILNNFTGDTELSKGNAAVSWEKKDIPVLVPHLDRRGDQEVMKVPRKGDTARQCRSKERKVSRGVCQVTKQRRDEDRVLRRPGLFTKARGEQRVLR